MTKRRETKGAYGRAFPGDAVNLCLSSSLAQDLMHWHLKTTPSIKETESTGSLKNEVA
jgi:hypothetical protein